MNRAGRGLAAGSFALAPFALASFSIERADG